ncbi:hypothetical protein C8J57DRAFT_1477689 [Mycena rebaudengoi]|nr:hypothetical protein C8J57DRAFT_1477689 [Mycena rebaudengoi]
MLRFVPPAITENTLLEFGSAPKLRPLDNIRLVDARAIKGISGVRICTPPQTISSSSAATTHSISLGFGVHRPHATLPGPSVHAPTLSPCRFRPPHTFMRTLRLWPSSPGPCTSRRERGEPAQVFPPAALLLRAPCYSLHVVAFILALFMIVHHTVMLRTLHPPAHGLYYLSSRRAICTRNNTTSEDRYYVGVLNKDESFETEVMLVAPPLDTYPLEKSEAVVVEPNSDENDGNTDM